MCETSNSGAGDELRAEYDLSAGVRGKYYQQYQAGTNVVFLDPDVAAVFRDSASVNAAPRLIMNVARSQVGPGG